MHWPKTSVTLIVSTRLVILKVTLRLLSRLLWFKRNRWIINQKKIYRAGITGRLCLWNLPPLRCCLLASPRPVLAVAVLVLTSRPQAACLHACRHMVTSQGFPPLLVTARRKYNWIRGLSLPRYHSSPPQQEAGQSDIISTEAATAIITPSITMIITITMIT